MHHTVKEKNFSQVFATALEVADSHEGDCTEHAVLLTALARALGMPARVVVGLVYVPSQQGFAYHMWTEIYDGKIWLPLDATVGRGSIGAGYLELGTSSLKDATGLAELLSVVQSPGQVEDCGGGGVLSPAWGAASSNRSPESRGKTTKPSPPGDNRTGLHRERPRGSATCFRPQDRCGKRR